MPIRDYSGLLSLKDYKKLLDVLLTLQNFNILLLNDLAPRAN